MQWRAREARRQSVFFSLSLVLSRFSSSSNSFFPPPLCPLRGSFFPSFSGRSRATAARPGKHGFPLVARRDFPDCHWLKFRAANPFRKITPLHTESIPPSLSLSLKLWAVQDQGWTDNENGDSHLGVPLSPSLFI